MHGFPAGVTGAMKFFLPSAGFQSAAVIGA